MNIYSIKESSLHETSGISVNIYISGCNKGKGYCSGCHSDHTWNPKLGEALSIEDIIKRLREIPAYKFDHICILGGEPLDQPEESIVELLKALSKGFNKPLWLYTHFGLNEVPQSILSELDYIKTGEFILGLEPAKEQYGVFLVGNNQVIHKLK